MTSEVQDDERDADKDGGDDRREVAAPSVGRVAGEVGGDYAPDAEEPEQSDHAVRVVKGRGGQVERERRPQCVEGGEDQRAELRASTKLRQRDQQGD